MIKKIIKSIIILSIISLTIYKYNYKTNTNHLIITNNPITSDKTNNNINIENLKRKYNNDDIVGYLEIPNVLSTILLQTNNNYYYLNHDNYKKENKKGAIFLDYRVNIKDNKLIVYGHSGEEKDLPFLALNNYQNENFYKKHNKIYLYTNDKIYTYKIFSSYIENNDFDYVNLKSFNGLSWKQHLNKLKSKSKYDTDTKISDDSKIIILQTCNINNKKHNGYQLVIGILKNINNL